MKQGLARQQGIGSLAIIGVVVVIALIAVAVIAALRYRLDTQVNESIALLQSTESAFQSYQEIYGQFPGDDGPLALLSLRGEQWSPVMSGDADGNLEAPDFRTFTGVDESGAFWQHLRAAGLLPGDPALVGVDALPINAFGGHLGVLAQPMGGGLTGTKLCLSRVPGTVATAIDASLDDGVGTSGRLRASVGSATSDEVPVDSALTTPYAAGEHYPLCYQLASGAVSP